MRYTVMSDIAKMVKSIAKVLLPHSVVARIRRHRDHGNLRRIGVDVPAHNPDVKYFGTEYGGYAVPVSMVEDGPVWSFGAGEDISFELLIARYFVTDVYICDPTPRAVSYCNRMINQERGLLGRVHFFPFGVWSETGTMRFFVPKNKDHCSHSIVNLQHTRDYFEGGVPVSPRYLERTGSESPAILKLNIEGAEYEVMRAIFDSTLDPKVICITFDELHTAIDGGADHRMTELTARFHQEGYEAIHAAGCKVTYARRSSPERNTS